MPDLDAVVAFATMLEELKRRSGRGYATLARRCGGISGSTLHRYCRGEGVPPDYSVVERIARVCSASPAETAELRRRWALADYHRRLIQQLESAGTDQPAPRPLAVAPLAAALLAAAAGAAPAAAAAEPAPGPEAAPRAPAIAAAPPPPGPEPAPAPGPHPGDRVRPRQLPATVPHFAGRAGELATLTALAERADRSGAPVVIASIGGTAGIGKTALALRWAHQVADRFPDGQLYVNLRGFDPTRPATQPGEAVRGFLEAFGVTPRQVPAGLDAQVGLYRSLLAGKRVLVVLDNARDSEQVRPLLPGTPGCLVLVTSRNQLGSLVAAEGAQPLTLDLLSPDEARQVLAGRLGPARVAAEPEAVAEIVTRCARLPLALSIVAARAAAHPAFPLATLLAELRQSGGLDAFAGEDAASDVRAVLSWSHGTLSDPAARLFRLLGLHPGPDIGVPAAASLLAVPPPRARQSLAELTRAHMLTEYLPGRYVFHDLLRAYAAEQAAMLETASDRYAASLRMLDHYLHSVHAAVLRLHPAADPAPLDAPADGVTVVAPPDRAAALDWLTGEHQVVLAAIDHAAAADLHRHSCRLAGAVATFLDRQGHWHDFARTSARAVAASERLGDPIAQARAHRGRGLANARLDQFEDAERHLQRAIELFAGAGDPVGQAYSHLNLAFVFDRQVRPDQALRHAEAAFGLFYTTEHRTGQAQSLNTVGWHNAQLGRHDRAIGYCRRALALLRELGHRNGQADTLDSLAFAHHNLGQYAEAVRCYRDALALYRELGDRHKEASTLRSLGDTYQAAGTVSLAEVAWQEALVIFEELRHPVAAILRAKLDT